VAHQPPFFHQKEGKDNGFGSILSKLFPDLFSESIHNQGNGFALLGEIEHNWQQQTATERYRAQLQAR
jgi:hypothetical protein